MFINAKDAPFAAVTMIALLGIVRALEEYPRATPPTLALCGVGIGLAVGTRVLGGFVVLAAMLSLVYVVAAKWRGDGFRSALAECGTFLVPFIPAAILGYLVMGLVWPWSVVSPLNPFHAIDYFSSFFDKPWRELFDGRLILVPDMPRSYAPTLEALTNPELMLVLGLCGVTGVVVAAVQGRGSVGRRGALLAVLFVATLPIIVTVATRPYMYNGVRHLVFTLPPFAVLGGLAAAWIAQPAGAAWHRGNGRRGADLCRGDRLAGDRDGAAPSLSIHLLQSHHRRRSRRAALFHGRLLGIVDDAGVTAIARQA